MYMIPLLQCHILDTYITNSPHNNDYMEEGFIAQSRTTTNNIS